MSTQNVTLHQQSFAQLAEDLPEVSELDLNPVVARPDGCVAVDARIRVHARPRAASLKGW